MVSLAKNAGDKEQKQAADDKKSKDKMNVVLVSRLSYILRGKCKNFAVRFDRTGT